MTQAQKFRLVSTLEINNAETSVLGPVMAVSETAVSRRRNTSVPEKFPAVRITNQVQTVCKHAYEKLKK